MSGLLIIFVSIGYLALLFGIAWWIERRRQQQKSVVRNGWVYALSLAVYCTAWTYYGSVGRAVTQGMDFITIYLGPSVMCALFIPLLRKIIRICKTQRINSIADFIASRYGKNFSLGVIVTLCCLVGIIPYIALQLKAISASFHTITGLPPATTLGFSDDKFYITLVIILFIILFGTRSVDATERHEGLVGAVAFESLVKLFAFLVVGCFLTFFVFDGYEDLFRRISNLGSSHFFTMGGPGFSYSSWVSMLLVSMLAVLLLPRQFQVSVVENTNEGHLKKAIWLFPLYMLAINIFVLPIAMAGHLMIGDASDADMYVLSLPLRLDQQLLSVLVYIGGFSAATSMIIVETIALATMVSNHLVLPLLFSLRSFRPTEGSLKRQVILSRRVIIALILMAAYFYNGYIARYFSLVNIGLASMAAVAQFAPAVIGGLYWRQASRKGAMAGILTGFALWFYTLIIPSAVNAGFIDASVMTHGPWHISWLRPQSLFGMDHLDLLSHSLFWSMLCNLLCYCIISVYARLSVQEIYQARLFVDIFDKDTNLLSEGRGVWKGHTPYREIETLVENFLGQERAQFLLRSYAKRHDIVLNQPLADPRMISFSEKILSGIIGSASARFMIGNIVREKEEVTLHEVLAIVKESQQVLELNKELKRKSIELSRATELLIQANEQLMKMDLLKDEFLYTVTHELRTPLTSIRALSEIVYDNPDMEEEQRQQYLEAVVSEIERLSHLITQVLNLERYESGRQKLDIAATDLRGLVAATITALLPLARDKGVRLEQLLPEQECIAYVDKDLIQQAVYNLVANAIKFAPEQGGWVKATLLCPGEDTLRLTVSDNGPGIPAEMREQIFDKFFQAKNQTLKKPAGTGLGLAICKKIMQMHQGTISVAGEEGAVFTMCLPRSPGNPHEGSA